MKKSKLQWTAPSDSGTCKAKNYPGLEIQKAHRRNPGPPVWYVVFGGKMVGTKSFYKFNQAKELAEDFADKGGKL